MIKLKFREYVQDLKRNIETQVQIAKNAHTQRNDPSESIEAKLTYSSKDKIAAILNIPGLEEYLPENLFQQENSIFMAADITKQIVNEKFIKRNREELILLALHSSLVILSQGLISVPQESIPKVIIGSKTNHLTIYFSNTIRYASGETIGLVILIADYIRHILHLNRYNPSPTNIERYIEELELYLAMNDRIQDLRNDLIKFLVQNIGVEISGEDFERIEVKKYRNLPNLTNQLRMGMCVAFDKIIEDINIIAQRRMNAGIPEWEWLSPPFETVHRKKQEFDLYEVRGTQPLISKSKKPGGFRLRYGISRNTGDGAAGIHPATMYLIQMLSQGTNIRIDLMERTLSVFPVSSILGPLVELKDGSSVRIISLEEAQDIENQIIQIWEMGDILISPDDIPQRETVELSSWTEEWWTKEILYNMISKYGSLENFTENFGLSFEELNNIFNNPTSSFPSFNLAVIIAKQTKTPIHPYYSFNWNEIAISDVIKLFEIIKNSKTQLLPNNNDLRIILLQLGVPFNISENSIISEKFEPFIKALKMKQGQLDKILSESLEEIEIENLISTLLGFEVRSLCNRRIGLKIIRAEKAESRHITPPAHVLFPVGSYGGTQKNLLKAMKESNVRAQLSERYCSVCDNFTFQIYCPTCKEETQQKYFCRNGHVSNERKCQECGNYGLPAKIKEINIFELLDSAIKKFGPLTLNKIKGVTYLNNKNRIPENVKKGILRSKYDIFVYKDGTTRFDQTNAPLTHFTPEEIHTTIDDLRQLGYLFDVFGTNLTQNNQIVELLPYDVIISKTAGEHFVRIANFIDDELVYLYNLSPYYRINTPENLIGFLLAGLSPFSSVAIVGRIIGYSNNDVIFAHPLWHKLKTRNCNGDIDSITLLLDILVNFSLEYVPTSRGGAMDIPFIINLPEKWDDIAVYANYQTVPLNLSFYHTLHSNPLKKELLSYKSSYLFPPFPKYHNIDNISFFQFKNSFKESKIVSKIETTLKILSRVRGIKEGEFVDNILEHDLLEKISNSFNRFFLQPVRCKKCKTTFRRIPLGKKCSFCHGDITEVLGLTLSEGWVLRYSQIINQLKKKYEKEISEYNKSWIELIELNKRLLFEKGPKPTTLFE